MRRSNPRRLAMVFAVALGVCAAVAVSSLGGYGISRPSASSGMPFRIAPTALQARISASDDPSLVRLVSTRAPRFIGTVGLAFALALAAARRVSMRERGCSWQHTSAASASSRAPPAPAATRS